MVRGYLFWRVAISHGLLDRGRQYLVVSVPTSSGKTLCGELSIIQELSQRPESNCFYVVPTRALVYEKNLELKEKLNKLGHRVQGATGALQRDETETSLLEDSQVIVCTPEKLDLMIRHQDRVLNRTSIFIIDETQMVSDDDRGLGIEFVVIKLLLLKPAARIILLSATLPNAEDYGRWLGREATVATSEWRPTRQRFGSLQFAPTPPRGSRLELSLYDPADHFDGITVELATYSRQPRTIAERAVWAANSLRVRGPVLIFCMKKSRCEQIAAAIVSQQVEAGADYQAPPSDIENLRRRIRREIAPEFLLDQTLAFKVAYHHADLPPRIRVELENLISNGHIDVIISTTTLAEGVNLPISSVIFEDWMTHPDARTGERPTPLEITKFANIAGRAGRAGKEAEGFVLFLESERENKQIETADGNGKIGPEEHFIRASYPPVLSRFSEIVQIYDVPSDEVLEKSWQLGDSSWRREVRRALRQFGSAVLHAMEVLDLDDDELADLFIEKSLLAVQAPAAKKPAKEWFRVWMRHYRSVSLAREELRPIAMQVGLPLRALHVLYERLQRDDALLEILADHHNAEILGDDLVNRASLIVSLVQELDWRPQGVPHGDLLASWIRAASISSLTEVYSPYLEYKTRHLERTCNYSINQLSNMGSWGMYAFSRVVELILGEHDFPPIVRQLPLMAYYGVNSIPAVLLCLRGVERIDAFRIGDAFLAQSELPASLSNLKHWSNQVGVGLIEGILRGQDEREIDTETLRILDLP